MGFAARQFYVRRFLRIFPIYYLTLFGMALIAIPAVLNGLGWHLCYLSNVLFAVEGEWHYPVEHLWTLAVEKQFYLLWPSVLLLCPRRRLGQLIVVVILCGPLYRLTAFVLDWNHYAQSYQLFSALDSFGAGALLAFLSQQPNSRNWKNTIGRIGLAVGLPLFVVLQVCRLNRWAPGAYLVLEYAAPETAFSI